MSADVQHRSRPNWIGKRPLVAKTCLGCGLLLDSRWYYLNRERADVKGWTARCKACRRPRSSTEKDATLRRNQENAGAYAIYRRAWQAQTLPAPRAGYEWTSDDLAVAADPSLTLLQKALRLGRTYMAVSAQCRRNGFESHVGLGEPTDEWRIYNPNEPAAA